VGIKDILKLIKNKEVRNMTDAEMQAAIDAGISASEARMASTIAALTLAPAVSRYNDFSALDAEAKKNGLATSPEEYVVLMKEPHSMEYRPMFHTKNLRNKPLQQLVNGVAQGPKIWSNDAGAVEYINEHGAGAAQGTLYQIKNRKGEIV
jgi:hypothetical protein